MENLKDKSTSELLSEWTRWDELRVWQNVSSIDDFPETTNALAAIATELDMRCVEAGISIVDGFPTFVCIIRESVVSRGIPFTTITVDVEATELHVLLGWLLLKKGGQR